MSNTIDAFKARQEHNKQMLEKLRLFVEKGRGFGLTPNQSLMDKLSTAVRSVDDGILKVALIGGFSEGKTSIASAWLERLDQSMNISQQESSNEVKIYHVGKDIELIDTPGLFGFKEQENSIGEIEKYKEITRKYVSEAHLVLYVMNSANTIKESHKDDLNWLFRDLNLLSRTVFVLSRFDEVADIEDDWDYRESLNTKKCNVLERLKAMIHLNDEEIQNIKIVGVSANPFGEGSDYWLSHLEEFKRISRIGLLQDATHQVIDNNGGTTPIVIEAQKSMIQDILGKQMPIVKKNQQVLNDELKKLSDMVNHLNNEIEPMEAKISRVQSELIKFVLDYFTSLIRQVKGTDLTTFSDFYEREIGKDGIILTTNIEQEFNQQCQAVSSTLRRIGLDFDNEVTRFESTIGSDLLNKGFGFLSKQKINNTQILAARDGVVGAGKLIGVDLAKYLKFKPWGAVNLAAKVNVVMASLGLVMEAWDSYKKAKAESEFKELVLDITGNLETQREGLLDSLKSVDFIDTLFPDFKILKQRFSDVETANNETVKRKEAFDLWQKEGALIEGEYRVLESSTAS